MKSKRKIGKEGRTGIGRTRWKKAVTAFAISAGSILPIMSCGGFGTAGPSVKTGKNDRCIIFGKSGPGSVFARKGSCRIRNGDDLIHAEFKDAQGAVYGRFSLSVERIGSKGIKIAMHSEFMSSEQAESYWNIDYGKTELFNSLGLSLKIKAEKGTFPGTAIVHIHD